MKKITDYEQISPLIMRYMKKGTETNFHLSADDYKAEIDAGTLSAHNWHGGLLLFRERNGFCKANYFVTNKEKFPFVKWPDPTVMEIVFRPGSRRDIVEYWEKCGFVHVFERIRMTRLPDSGGAGPQLEAPAAVEPDLAEKMLNDSFDRRTACLPSREEIEADASEGRLLSRYDEEGALAALLRVRVEKAHVEIRHMCVKPQMRNKGLAEQLTEECIARFGDKKCRVWVRSDYDSARGVYELNGFTQDGWKSVVLIRTE